MRMMALTVEGEEAEEGDGKEAGRKGRSRRVDVEGGLGRKEGREGGRKGAMWTNMLVIVFDLP